MLASKIIIAFVILFVITPSEEYVFNMTAWLESHGEKWKSIYDPRNIIKVPCKNGTQIDWTKKCREVYTNGAYVFFTILIFCLN